MSNFFKKLIPFAVFVAFIIQSWNMMALENLRTLHAWPILFCLIMTSIIFHRQVEKAASVSALKSARVFLAGTTIKIMLSVVVILLYGFLNREHIVSFILMFMVQYLLFLAFEVYAMMHFLKGKN